MGTKFHVVSCFIFAGLILDMFINNGVTVDPSNLKDYDSEDVDPSNLKDYGPEDVDLSNLNNDDPENNKSEDIDHNSSEGDNTPPN